MAHSPEKRAEAVADYLGGMSWDATCAKHGVGIATLKRWVDESKTEVKRKPSEIVATPQEARSKRFNDSLEKFLGATLDMLNAWAEECADRKFIQGNPTGVHELGKTVLDRADRLVGLVRSSSDDTGNPGNRAG